MDEIQNPNAVAAPVPEDRQERIHVLNLPVNVRSMALVVLVVLAGLATLRFASGFFIPLMLGFMFSYALSPVVNALEGWRVPRAISAAVLILGILGGAGGGESENTGGGDAADGFGNEGGNIRRTASGRRLSATAGRSQIHIWRRWGS